MAQEIVLGKLIVDNSDLDKAMFDSRKAVADLEAEQKKLKKETDNLSSANVDQLETFVRNETALKAARAEYSANQKTILGITKAQNGLDEALSSNIRTQDEAIANTKQLIEARRKIDTTTTDGAAAVAQINAKIGENNKLVNDNSSALEQQKNNVGNYPTIMNAVSSSFGDATRTVVGFATQGKAVIGELSGTVAAYKQANEASTVATKAFAAAQIAETAATQAATVAEVQRVAVGFQYAAGKATETEVEAANTAATAANATATAAQTAATNAGTTATTASAAASKILRIAMLGIPLFALLALLAPLVSFLTSTQEGMDKITAVTRPLIAIFQSFIGVLQNVGKSLFETFENPKKALNDLYEFVKQNLINRFKAFAVILDGIINLDFGKVTNGVLQAGTGVENLTGKIKGAAKETAQFLAQAAARGAEIDKLQKSIEKSEASIASVREENNTKIKELDKIVKNTSLNIAERTKANQQQNDLAKENAKLEQNILDLKIKKLTVEQSLNDTNRAGNKEYNLLIAEGEKIKQRVSDEELGGIRVIATARKEAQSSALAAAKEANDSALKESRNKIDLIKLEATQQDLSVDKRISNAKLVFDLENDLAKRSSTGSDQKKALIQNRQDLSTEILAIAQSQIEKEIEDQKKLFTEKKKITDDERNSLITSAEDLASAQILLLDKNIISERAYSEQVIAINNAKNEAITIANTSFDEGDKIRKQLYLENEKALSDVAFELKVQDIIDRDATEQEIKTELLAANYQREQDMLEEALANKTISEDVYNQKKLLAEKKYTSDTTKNDKILARQKNTNNVKMASDAIGALQGLFGESKALSVAAALINTYEGISAGVKLGYPQAIPAVAMAAATGFAAVKNILKTSKSTGGGAAESSPQTTSGAGSFVNGQTSTIATVSDRPVEQNTVVSPPVLVLETLQEVQGNVLVKINSD